MRLHFVFPRWKKLLDDCPELVETLSGREIGVFRMAGLGIPTAVGAVPDPHTVSMTDEHIEPIDYDVDADLICLSYFTPQAANAHAIADRFRAAGRTVIAGGIHPTLNPNDALEHVDAVVRGPVEGLWPRILEDAAASRLESVYTSSGPAPFAVPRRDLFRPSGYLRAGIVQTARGCGIGCPFCIVPDAYGRAIVFKPIDEVLDDIRSVPYPCFYFADENLLFGDPANRRYRHDLLGRMIDRRIRKVFFLAAYPFMLRPLDGEEVGMLAAAGCRQVYLVLGLADPLSTELEDPALLDALQRLRDAGIETMASFTLGHDLDAPRHAEDAIAAFCERGRVNLAEFTLWTPFPGTPTFRRMEAKGRILTRDWSRYNGANVVFAPARESPDDLANRFVRMWQWFYDRIRSFELNQRYAKGFGTGIFRND